jgi:hypothetical protein
MNYNFDFAVSATISAKVVEEMVKKIVEDQTGRKVKKITFKTKEVSSGGYRDDYSTTVFDGCTVDFIDEATVTTKKRFDHDFSNGGLR